MSATIKFPRKKKRGRKVMHGPMATVVALPIPTDLDRWGRTQPQGSNVQRGLDRLHELARQRFERHSARNREIFNDWLEGIRKVDEELYAAGSNFGRASDHFGEGPDLYRWAVQSVAPKDILRINERNEALNLAIATLNKVAFLLRHGGMDAGGGYVVDEEKFDKEAHRAFEQHSISDVAEAMVRLRAFGARA
jgi:hypothetical protein